MQIGSAHDPFSEQLITRIDGNLSSLVTGKARAILLVTRYLQKKKKKKRNKKQPTWRGVTRGRKKAALTSGPVRVARNIRI